MISQILYELSCLPMRYKAWRKGQAVGVQRKGYVRIYDYSKNRKKK